VLGPTRADVLEQVLPDSRKERSLLKSLVSGTLSEYRPAVSAFRSA
jgi:hypothetical protein